MVTKVLVDSGKYGVVQGGDYSTGSVPAAAAVPYPKYIVCGAYSGAYGIAYWDGSSKYSPVFNQNDPRVKNWALVCSSLASGRVFMFSFASMTNNKSMMYVFELDQTDVRSGTFGPKTTQLYNAVLTGSIDVESLLNIPDAGADVFFLRTSSECLSIGLASGNIFIKRLSISTSRCRHNGNVPYVLLSNGSSLFILDVVNMTTVQAVSAYSLDPNTDRWWPVSTGFYMCDKHGGPTPQIVATRYEWLNGSAWETFYEVFVSSFLRTYLIALSGEVTVTNDNGVVEVTPPNIIYYDPGDGSTRRRTEFAAPDPFPNYDFSRLRCYGAGGNNYPLIAAVEIVLTEPATAWGPAYFYNVDAGPTSASNFKSKVIDFRALPVGTGASSITFYTNNIKNELNYGPRQINVPMNYDPIVAWYSPTWGTTIRSAKNEINGVYGMGSTFDVLYYITPLV